MNPSLQSELVLLPVAGVRLATAAAGIKKSANEDLLLIEIADHSQVAAVFTANRFAAAPVELCRQYLQEAKPRYLLINSGNANCGLGAAGLEAARICCESVASAAAVSLESVLPFSTGVIAEPLPAQKIVTAVPDLLKSLDSDQWVAGADAIRTTDTVAKGGSRVIDIDGVAVTITGICKGSGMIRPNMATMLAYIATDAAVADEVLQPLLNRAVGRSFNCISVDGDMSTNDACLLIATGKAGNPELGPEMAEPWRRFEQAVTELCTELAQLIVRDGEGATKFITIQVRGAAGDADARAVAEAVAHSPLVKTAFFASDANWGRILAAVGYAPIANLDINKVEIFLGDVCIVRNGARADEYEEAAGAAVMAQGDITLTIDLHSGDGRLDFWTCDLSYDYVRINAEYRT
ncbi:MAG: bifunctional glutamate N-acetyltransferase/amino-acid acetyltransferase ArgJ [Immundisolibacteraceae bacterium]|nr:bifunctional glutamate N-acetyltransferase/amino-acid acetyltransferase ArgJ [Immundisolibacteraceae bacterium]